MATTNILHLSDLHFGWDGDATGRADRAEVLNGLIKVVGKLGPLHILVISGDLTCKGRQQGYTELKEWLPKLLKAAKLNKKDCVICPGNHDIDRAEVAKLTAKITDVKSADTLLRPEKLTDSKKRIAGGYARPFHRFQAFATEFGIIPVTLGAAKNYLAGVRSVTKLKLRFICVNSAWFCGSSPPTDKGKLWLGLPQLIGMQLDPDEYDSGPVTIALVHHPDTWLAEEDSTSYPTRTSAYSYLADRAHLILSGHTHGSVREGNRLGGRAHVLTAGATYESAGYRNNFSVLQLDGRKVTRLPWEYDPGARKWEQKAPQIITLRTGQDAQAYLDWLRIETSEVDLRNFIDRRSTPDPKIDALYARLMTAAGETSLGGKGAAAGKSPIPLDKALKHRRLLIVGDAGSGKSTFLRRVAFALSREGRDPVLRLPHLRFPIFVRVRELDAHIRETKGGPDKPDDPAWLPHFLAKKQFLGLDETFWRDQLNNSKSILLLDGLDEAANSERRAHLVTMLESIAKTAACHIAVTTRPMDLTRNEKEGWQTIHIAPLDQDGTKAFLLQWSRWLKKGNEPAAQKYYEHLQPAVSIPDLRDMVSNPLMLTSLAVLYLNGQELPRGRAGLYDGILTWLARHAHEHCRTYSEGEYLDRLAELALGMQITEKGQTLKIDEAGAARLITRPGRSVEPALEFITLAQLHSGMITLRGGLLEFWHRSFQEYLAARCLVGFLDAKRLSTALRLLYAPEGREVLPLLAVRLSTPQLIHLLSGLINDARKKVGLDQRAYAVGVLGRIFADIKPKELADLAPSAVKPYQGLLDSVMGIFKKGIAAGIGVETRAAAAEALDQADPRARLYTPLQGEYWSPILKGTFTIGGDKEAYRSLPKERVTVPEFQIGHFPVTVWEYAEYLKEKPPGVEPPEDWEDQLKHLSRPVVNVNRNDADRYCKHFDHCHLPTDKQWEFAARGTASRIYPWEGNAKPGEPRANCNGVLKAPSPVGIFPDGDTPDGVSDMLGNVWEWTSSEFETGRYSVRGASFDSGDSDDLRAAARYRVVPDVRDHDLGFRCVREVIP